MKKLMTIPVLAVTMLLASLSSLRAQNASEPWTKAQLMEPSTLAALLNDKAAKKPLVYSVGPGGNIKGSIEMGPAQDRENLDKLKKALDKVDRNTPVVIYCGCCPFKNCPNIRPAFTLLNTMGFKQHKLLNLSHNLKVDWIDKGYPMNN